jgi:hypothetical protein
LTLRSRRRQLHRRLRLQPQMESQWRLRESLIPRLQPPRWRVRPRQHLHNLPPHPAWLLPGQTRRRSRRVGLRPWSRLLRSPRTRNPAQFPPLSRPPHPSRLHPTPRSNG